MGMAINQEMPEDVLMLILSRLPVQSLLRFRSVSKYWYSLIQNPSFISIHNNRSRKNDSLLVTRYPKKDSNSTPSPVSNETSILDLDVRFGNPHVGDLHLLGSSNGLVCLADPSAEIIIVLCNPVMREFRVLPRFPLNGASCTNLGFAFDPKTNDYIVLRVAPRYEYDSMICFYTLVDEKVQMYHMSTDSWREIIATVPKDRIWHAGLSLSRSTVFNGVLYWVGCDPCGGYTVIAFHMFDKLFEQVFLPEDICVNPRSSISVLRDSLAFVSSSEFNWLGKYSCFDIWVRDGNGVEDLWNKKYSIGPILGIYDPLACRQNGELLLLRDNDFQMVSYNLDTHQVKTYQEGYDKFHVLSYTELSFSQETFLLSLDSCKALDMYSFLVSPIDQLSCRDRMIF